METLEKEAEKYADRVIGYLNENETKWQDAQRHIVDFYKESKWVKAEKIKAKIELLKDLGFNFDLESTHTEEYYIELNYLEQTLKELENGNN